MLPKFLFVESPELPGAGFILSSNKPCYMAKLIKFSKPEDLELLRMKSDKLFTLVPGYMIVVQYFTTFPSETEISSNLEEVKTFLNEVAAFYLDSKIKSNPGYYKRNLL